MAYAIYTGDLSYNILNEYIDDKHYIILIDDTITDE